MKVRGLVTSAVVFLACIVISMNISCGGSSGGGGGGSGDDGGDTIILSGNNESDRINLNEDVSVTFVAPGLTTGEEKDINIKLVPQSEITTHPNGALILGDHALDVTSSEPLDSQLVMTFYGPGSDPDYFTGAALYWFDEADQSWKPTQICGSDSSNTSVSFVVDHLSLYIVSIYDIHVVSADIIDTVTPLSNVSINFRIENGLLSSLLTSA